ncbi:MAG: GNAT family N-acetyltransferase [Myxococcales bacterium]|nr:GNAT family N-acetyltransferase [Myxococcales bacterium]
MQTAPDAYPLPNLPPAPTLDTSTVRAAERAEASAWTGGYAALIASGAAGSVGAELIEEPQANSIFTGAVPDWSLNRLLGLNAGASVDEPWLETAVARYAERGLPCTLAHNERLDADRCLGAWLRARATRQARPWCKMLRSTAAPPLASTALTLRHAGPEDREAVGALMQAGFGLPAAMARCFTSVIGHKDWVWYLACAAGQPAAVGALHLADGGVGWMGMAATAREHRGQGAQGAIMAARIAEAGRRGCSWVTTETGIPVDDAPSPSLNNMLRLGFGAICVRRNWIVDPPAG